MLDTTRIANENQVPEALDAVLDNMDAFFAERVYLTEGQRAACVLWAAHTYVYGAFKNTPRLLLTAPDWGVGKTETLETVMGLSDGGRIYEWGISESAIIRMYRAQHGDGLSMGLDQCDSLDRADKSLLNTLTSGYRVGATTAKSVAMGKDGKDWQPDDFVIGWPMAFAKIGDLPTPQIMSRCVVIRMQPSPVEMRQALRKAQRQLTLFKVEENRLPSELALKWRGRISRAVWARQDELADFMWSGGQDGRTEDVWEPLFAIAQLAGNRWRQRLEAAYRELQADNKIVPKPFKQYLAAILRGIQHDKRDFLPTEALMHLSGFWPIVDDATKDQSGKLLGKRGAGLESDVQKIDGKSVRGYWRSAILETCRRWAVEPAEVGRAVTGPVTGAEAPEVPKAA